MGTIILPKPTDLPEMNSNELPRNEEQKINDIKLEEEPELKAPTLEEVLNMLDQRLQSLEVRSTQLEAALMRIRGAI